MERGPMSMEPIRETYILLPEGTDLLMYLVLLPFAVVFLYGLYRRLSVTGLPSLRDIWAGLPYAVRFGLLQRRVVRERLAGLMHVSIYSGILALFIGTSLVFIDYDILRNFQARMLRGDFYLFYEAALDFMGLALLAGLGLLFYRRLVLREARLRPKLEYLMVLSGLFFIGLTGYLLEGIRLTLEPRPWGGWSFVGKALSDIVFAAFAANTLQTAYVGLWWSHAIVAFTMVALLPYSSLYHIFSTLLHIAANAPKQPPTGKMNTPFKLEELTPEAEIKVGFRKVGELSGMGRLELDACTDCGRCEAACPAFEAGTPLSPRMIVQKLKNSMWMDGGLETDVFTSGLIDEEEVWACTSCGACIEACPVLIRPMNYILEMRRALTLEGRLDKRKNALLTNLARYGNPYGLDPSVKQEFVEELKSMGVRTVEENPDAEYVYWIGCASIYDARGREIVKNMARILLRAGVSFAILGVEESCTGDPARRVGEEGRFQEMALANIEKLKSLKAKKILVNCPHCYNTFKNEYGEFGLTVDVQHHTQLIAELLRNGKLSIGKGLSAKITLHDSCYLARHNGVISEPRTILSKLAGEDGFIELKRSGLKSFCCGAGGSTYWYEVRRRDRESIIRLREVLGSGAGVLAVECPYCMQMFADAARVMGVEDKIKLKDVAEVVAEAVEK